MANTDSQHAGETLDRTLEYAGCDTDGTPYPSSSRMWAEELVSAGEAVGEVQASITPSTKWYEKSSKYWERQAPTVAGMLGGLEELHERDIRASQAFLTSLARTCGLSMDGVALDVGAGIGRVSRDLLLPMFARVDMLEQNKEYLKKSEAYLSEVTGSFRGRIERRVPTGMQHFCARNEQTGENFVGRYSVIWAQWCIIYLTDEDLINFIQTCFECLQDGGVLCIKDNTLSRGQTEFVLDKQDSSVMRGLSYMRAIFERANARVLKEEAQRDMPATVFPVRTWALVPASRQQHNPYALRSKTDVP